MSHSSKQDMDDAIREGRYESALADAQSIDLVRLCQHLDGMNDKERRELSSVIPTIRRLIELEWRVRQLSEPLALMYPKAFAIAKGVLGPRKTPTLPTKPTAIHQMATDALRVLNAGDAPKCGPKGELSRLVWEAIPQVADCPWMQPTPPTDPIEPTTHAKLSELLQQYGLQPDELAHLYHELESAQDLLFVAILGFDSDEDQEVILRNRKAMLHLGLAVMRYRRAAAGRPPKEQNRTPWQTDVADALKAAGLPHDERILRR